MRKLLIVLGAALAASATLAAPAHARRTVIDLGVSFDTSGYCSPNTVGPFAGECAPKPLGFDVQLAGQTFDSFYINSNGVLSFGSIQDQLVAGLNNPSQTLGDYSVPVFSANFNDESDFKEDGAFVSQVVSSTSDLLKVAFYECRDPGLCGLETINRGLGFAPSFYLTFEELVGGGFSLAYEYDQPLLGREGTYGFNLPSTGLIESTGPLQNQTFIFDANGQLANAVPEPSTWLMMLLGFGALGFAARRERRLRTQLA